MPKLRITRRWQWKEDGSLNPDCVYMFNDEEAKMLISLGVGVPVEDGPPKVESAAIEPAEEKAVKASPRPRRSTKKG